MRKRIQVLIGFTLLLIYISTIVNGINIGNEKNRRNANYEVYSSIINENKTENTDVYNGFLKNYNSHGQEYYYSIIELDGFIYPILLLSNGVYKFDHNRYVAMCTGIYYPVQNKVTLFGNICSNGTAYPISANATGIFTASGHEVAKYNLDLQSQKLKLIKKYLICFNNIGEEVKAITIRIIGDKNKISSEEEFDKAYKEYANANIIYFKRLFDNKYDHN